MSCLTVSEVSSPELSDHAVAHGGTVEVGVLEVATEEGDPEGPDVVDAEAGEQEAEVLGVAEDPPEGQLVKGVQQAGEDELNAVCHINRLI